MKQAVNGRLSLTFAPEAGITAIALHAAPNLFKAKGDWFILYTPDVIRPKDCEIRVCTAEDGTEKLIAMEYVHPPYTLRVSVLYDGDNEMRLHFALKVDMEYPKDVWLALPFLAGLALGCDSPYITYPGGMLADLNGNMVAKTHPGFPLPYVLMDAQTGRGLMTEFPSRNVEFASSQNRNMDLRRIANREQLENHRLLLRPGGEYADAAVLNLRGISNGWEEMCRLWRQGVREKYRMDAYRTAECAWFQDCLLTHFTYLYSKEAYDYEAGRVDIKKVLAQGEAFGGYDALILWHQYPRLGLDERSQWDFFRDFPGGIEGLRLIADEAHLSGVKVFLPYKPWDVRFSESHDDSAYEIRELIESGGVDGFFLDTMNSVPPSFRAAAKETGRDIAFCAEMHPGDQNAIEQVMGSWDQIWTSFPMPEIDVMRYALPEHAAACIARWHTDKRREAVIHRAIFSGVGLIIWQDVFGAYIPFEPEHRALIKKYKAIWQRFRICLKTAEPCPLAPSLAKGVYINLFPAPDGRAQVITLYNEASEAYEGPLMACEGKKAREWLHDLPFKLENGILAGSLPPESVAIVSVEA